ncbi:tetrahydromethanopterin S-methyltransferase subunit H [Candidatus Bipolaricaulota bacterium]|nr:tetrahydromethanopterin S-methyltransferase subunit H [Candidatus Bipolaricaulota bacterium]
MFKFGDQKILKIGDVEIGGEPGKKKTVLIGSIFYSGHNIVEDERKGVFDKEAAEDLIIKQEELSDKSGNPCLLDIIGMSKEAIKKYIDFVAEVTDTPFLIDSAVPSIKIAAIRHVEEIGLEDKIVYNSISPESRDEEIEVLADSKIEAAIPLLYTPNVTSANARIDSFKRILPRLEKARITKPLIDTFVMDVPSLPAAAKAAIEIKREYGLPCGSAAHNAIASWKGLKNILGKEAEKPATLIADLMQIILGSDFVLYGPIEDAELVFPGTFIVDTAYRYFSRMKDEFIEL